jgi:hypothetical protein
MIFSPEPFAGDKSLRLLEITETIKSTIFEGAESLDRSL